jgi:tetratricopeptide (TPR) repeat protein
VTLAEIRAAHERGEHETVVRLSGARLAARPGDDAAHEYRARALLALGRTEEAEADAADAVRLDPDEIRYRELLAEVRARLGAHDDAAWEYARLARNDPRQADWILAEARERLNAADPRRAVDAARQATRLDPHDGRAHLALSRGLARIGDGHGAVQAGLAAVELLPGDAAAQEALADARWLADDDAVAFEAFRGLVAGLAAGDRRRVLAKARALYRQHAGWAGQLVARIGPLFALAFERGWLRV